MDIYYCQKHQFFIQYLKHLFHQNNFHLNYQKLFFFSISNFIIIVIIFQYFSAFIEEYFQKFNIILIILQQLVPVIILDYYQKFIIKLFFQNSIKINAFKI